MYIIIGANGFLGSYLIKNIIKKTNKQILAVCRNINGLTPDSKRIEWFNCDVTKYDDLVKLNSKMKSYKEKCNVIYLSAYHNPDLVDKNFHMAWNVNVTSLSVTLNLLENVRCFFYPSTDSVYGNSYDSYHFREDDKLNPVNKYGIQKMIAESLVIGYGYNVVRYPFLIGPSLLMHKKHFYDQIFETIQKGDNMEMFCDSVRSSLDFGTASALLIDLIELFSNKIPNIVNISGDDDLSKYDVGLMIAKSKKIPTNLIVPISSENTMGIFEAKRAKSTLLDNSCIKKLLNVPEIKINI